MAKKPKMTTRRFNAASALALRDSLLEWSESDSGLSFYRYSAERFARNYLGVTNYNEAQLSTVTDVMRRGAVLGIDTTSPILATDEFFSMSLTMADQSPADDLLVEDLMAPEGLVVFETPQLLELKGIRPLENVRAISWGTAVANKMIGAPSQMLRANLWCEARAIPRRFQVPADRPLAALLAVNAFVIDGKYNDTGTDPVSRLLRSITALSRSSLTATDHGFARAQPGARKGIKDGQIRRIYLKNPDIAAFEADELAAERDGRPPVRAHWVRGHWKNQWYSAAEVHRQIWITPHIRGSQELGTVGGERILIAKA